MTPITQPEIGKLIHALRQELGLTQEKFAAKLGVTFPTVNRWENSHGTPSGLSQHNPNLVQERAESLILP